MSLPHIILWGLALVVGLSSAWRNPTALALVLAFAVSEAGLPPAFYAWPDVFIVAMIFTKPRYRPCEDYWDLSTWEQLKCIVSERAPADRFVMLSIPMAWCFYAPSLSYTQWWSLFYIAVAQYLVVGLSPLLKSRRRYAEAADFMPDRPGDLLVASLAGGRFG